MAATDFVLNIDIFPDFLLNTRLHKEESSSFLQKRTKKLLQIQRAYFPNANTKLIKVFWFFFAKKNCFLSLASRHPKAPT
jgi:hypothetical protein